MTNEERLKEFYLWVDQNLTGQNQNLLKSVELAKCVITNAIEQCSIKNESNDTNKTKLIVPEKKIDPVDCGIYVIINKINDRWYVGSSVTIRTRWLNHINNLNRNKHHCKQLQNDWNVFNKNDFEFKIVELSNENNLTYLEKEYYNCFKVMGGCTSPLVVSNRYNSSKINGRPNLSYKTTVVKYNGLLQALKEANGNQTKAANLLGISRRTICRYVKQFGVVPPTSQ